MRLKSSLGPGSAVPAVAGLIWSATAGMASICAVRALIDADGGTWPTIQALAIPSALVWIAMFAGVAAIACGPPESTLPLDERRRMWRPRLTRWPILAISTVPALVLSGLTAPDWMTFAAVIGQSILGVGLLLTRRAPAGFVPVALDTAARQRTDIALRRLASGLTVHGEPLADHSPVATAPKRSGAAIERLDPPVDRSRRAGDPLVRSARLGVFDPGDMAPGETDSISEVPEADGEVMQQFTRVRTADGADRIEGTVLLHFAPGQKLIYGHIPFVPPFESAPEMECETLDAEDSIRVRAAAAWPFGVRIEGRRSDAHAAAQVQIGFHAVGKARRAV